MEFEGNPSIPTEKLFNSEKIESVLVMEEGIGNLFNF